MTDQLPREHNKAKEQGGWERKFRRFMSFVFGTVVTLFATGAAVVFASQTVAGRYIGDVLVGLVVFAATLLTLSWFFAPIWHDGEDQSHD